MPIEQGGAVATIRTTPSSAGPEPVIFMKLCFQCVRIAASRGRRPNPGVRRVCRPVAHWVRSPAKRVKAEGLHLTQLRRDSGVLEVQGHEYGGQRSALMAMASRSDLGTERTHWRTGTSGGDSVDQVGGGLRHLAAAAGPSSADLNPQDPRGRRLWGVCDAYPHSTRNPEAPQKQRMELSGPRQSIVDQRLGACCESIYSQHAPS